MKEQNTRRAHGPVERRGVGDTDAVSRAQLIERGSWSLVAGFVGILGGLAATGTVWGALLGFFVGALFAAGVSLAMGGLAGRLFARIHSPKGASTPHRVEYSRADALTARGRYAEALDALETVIAQGTDDPAPYMRIARIHRDHLGQHEEAIRWFRRARDESRMSAGREAMVCREIVEVFQTHIGEPRRAAPELARMCDRFEGTQHAKWARRELVEMKKQIRSEDG